MSARTLELKLAAPVVCTDCDWHGKTGSLISGGSGPGGVTTLRCPMCQGARIVWIEAPGTETRQ